jgi:autotransporter adhesin
MGSQGPAGVVATNAAGAYNFSNVNGFAALGTYNSGQLGASGPGLRLLWYPRKGAFRAGQINGEQWDDVNIGNYSIAMGQDTQASGQSSTAFGNGSVATGMFSFAAGGGAEAAGNFSAALGNSHALGNYAVAAGNSNYASGLASVAIGASNTASGVSSTALGQSNQAMGDNSVAMGFASAAGGATSTAIGHGVLASGRMSLALGTLADTNLRDGAFVYGDRSTLETTGEIVQATTPNEFVVRASGGFRFRTSPTLSTGCNLPAGSGTWSCTSTRTAKHLFQDVNGEDLLVRLRRVPVSTWSYLGEEGGVRHMGPFAEDFRAAFGLGVNDVSIGLQDIDGVNMAAVQALVARTDALQRDNAAQAARIKELEAEMAVIRSLLLRSGVRR